METQTSLNKASWTWADQISSYKFWGIFLFFIFLLIPNVITNVSFSIFMEYFSMNVVDMGQAMVFKSIASFAGLWLAWFMVRMKNHYLLFLYSGFTIIGLLLPLIAPSAVSLYICFFLTGLGFGAISLAIPAIISGGNGGSEMFVVSFGIISFFNLVTWTFSSGMLHGAYNIVQTPEAYIILGLVSSLIGTILLLPVKAKLFNTPPPVRKKFFTPIHREPLVVALLCSIPLFNAYYILHLSYRFHGEINQINPTQNILSPRAAVWSTLFLSIILSPIILSSLNTNLIPKLKENQVNRFYKTWVIIFWAFIFAPISYTLIQYNINQLLKVNSDDIEK